MMMQSSIRSDRRTRATFVGLTFGWTLIAVGQETSRPRWVTTWGANLVEVPAINQLTITNQTLRQVVLSTIRGTQARVRISNDASSRAVSIGSAHIALSDTGSRVVPSSSREITFGGRRSIVVQPGGTIVSDPIRFEVPPLAPLAVSLFLPDTTLVAAIAIAGGQRSYTSSAGNYAAAASFPVQSVRVGWTLLVGVDVVNDAAEGLVVVFGSSIAGGGNSALPGNRWPDVMARRLLTSADGPRLGVVAATISGNRILGGGRGIPMLSRFERDVLGQSGVTHVIIAEGLNDISFAASDGRGQLSADDIKFGLAQLVMRAREHGLRVFAGTMTPSEGTSYGAPARRFGLQEESMRAEVNAWIRSASLFDGVIDFDKCVRDPDHPTRLRPSFDSGDHLHLNDAGYRALGECIDITMLKKPGSR